MKKRKSNNFAVIRFLKTLIIINAPFLNRIMEFDNFNNDSDYNVIITYAWEEPILKPAIAAIKPRSGNYSIVKIKLYQ